MNVRFVRNWCRGAFVYEPGREVDFPDGMATELIRRGIVEKIEEPETASLAPPERNATIKRPKGRQVEQSVASNDQ